MLGEIAAANAAFAIIRTAVQNSGDLLKAGKAIGDFVSAKDELERKVAQKRARGVADNDLVEFLQLEEIKQKEKQLRELMLYSGRPGLLKDYDKFCEDARNGRAAAKRAADRRRADLLEKLGLGMVGLFLAACVGAMAYVVLIMKNSVR